jgi:hypothetical protein
MEMAMVQASVVAVVDDDVDVQFFSSGTIVTSIPPPSSVRTLIKIGSVDDVASNRSARNHSAIPKSLRKGQAAKPLMVRQRPVLAGPPKQKKFLGADLGNKDDRAAPAVAVLKARTMVSRSSGVK